MCGGRVIREAADLALPVIHQPADTVLRRVVVNKWAVLVWHLVTLANS